MVYPKNTPTTTITNWIGSGRVSTPRMKNSRNAMIPPTMAPMALIPSQSATRRSLGLPASASRFSVRSLNDEEATRFIRPDSDAASGRRVRSKNGCWSSSSSRFLASIVPSWVSRAWTGSIGAEPVNPRTMSRMAPAAAPATRMATGSIG
jgi:hypothetical protein